MDGPRHLLRASRIATALVLGLTVQASVPRAVRTETSAPRSRVGTEQLVAQRAPEKKPADLPAKKKGKAPEVVRSKGAANKQAAELAAPAFTPEREAAVMKFVEQHHPELGALLKQLKESNSSEYERAIRDLFRVSERLADTQEKDLQRYELELRRWQVQSKIDLLAARLRMSGGEELKKELRQAVDEMYSVRQSLLRLERGRVAERLKKLDAQLETSDARRQEIVEREWRNLTNSADADQRRSVTGKKKSNQ